MYKNILFLSFVFLFVSCSSNEEVKPPKIVSQNPTFYTQDIDTVIFNQNKRYKNLIDKHFRPWEIRKFAFSKKEALWGMMYAKRDVYGTNFQKIPAIWFKKQKTNANFSKYNTTMQKAITVKNASIRVLPSDDKIFYSYKDNPSALAFDYNQASSIKLNTPIMISHLSKDKQWAYIQTAYTSGWVKLDAIAYVSKKVRKLFRTKEFFIATKDKFSIYKNGMFLEKVRLGTIFPYVRGKDKDSYLVVRKHGSLKGLISNITISRDFIKKAPITFNAINLNILTNELINEPYGWGGTFQARDCSELTRDFLSPFGIFLARNSKSQTKNGKYLSLKDLSNDEKKKFLIKNAIPYLTLVYKKGHIMLYIGHKNGEPMVFHNLWSVVAQDKEGLRKKHIIGKTIISSLEPYTAAKQENTKSLLSKIEGIVILN